MSNETMTDARALAGKIGVFYAAHESCKPGAPFYAFTETELEVFVDRLRGEAARPVAWTSETQLKSVVLTGDGIMGNASSGWNVPLYAFPPGKSSAAPAPVAGDVVAYLHTLSFDGGREHKRLTFDRAWPFDYVAGVSGSTSTAELVFRAALAQDRASQAGAAGVPEPREVPKEHEPDDGCNCQWRGEAIGWNDCRATMLAAAPTPAAEGEVRNG